MWTIYLVDITSNYIYTYLSYFAKQGSICLYNYIVIQVS